jgi:hypothetical protein
MKNSWMYGIIGACMAFISLMTGFGIMASHHHLDLVVTDYYKEEINYQKQINKINNYKSLTNKPEIIFDSMHGNMLIRFPGYEITNAVTGRVCLYRPNDRKYDDTLALAPNAAGLADIPLSNYQKGKWKMRIAWEQGKKGYFVEKAFKLK